MCDICVVSGAIVASIPLWKRVWRWQVEQYTIFKEWLES